MHLQCDILAASLSRTETDQPVFECCSSLPTFAIISSVSFTRRNRESLHGISLVRQKESNKNRYIYAVFRKMHQILLPKWKRIFKILNFFSILFQRRPQFYVGRSGWTAWNVSGICPVVVVHKVSITTPSCSSPFAYHWNISGNPRLRAHNLSVADGIGQCFLPRTSNLTT